MISIETQIVAGKGFISLNFISSVSYSLREDLRQLISITNNENITNVKIRIDRNKKQLSIQLLWRNLP